MSTENQTKNNNPHPQVTKSKRFKLAPFEQKFIANYIKSGDGVWSLKESGYPNTNPVHLKNKSRSLLNSPRILEEIDKIMAEARTEAIANANEVMEYFTSVMRGEVKDQFGLDAPLTEKTRAAIELARRTVDVENRQKLLEEGTPVVTVKLIRD